MIQAPRFARMIQARKDLDDLDSLFWGAPVDIAKLLQISPIAMV